MPAPFISTTANTTSGSLGDNTFSDVLGGVVLDKNNAELGTILIDVGDGKNKSGQVFTLGHEIIETNTLRLGTANDDAQEVTVHSTTSYPSPS